MNRTEAERILNSLLFEVNEKIKTGRHTKQDHEKLAWIRQGIKILELHLTNERIHELETRIIELEKVIKKIDTAIVESS